MARVVLENLGKAFSGKEVVRGINLEIADNELVVLVGPSGCGKSTTLRMIAGLEEITRGKIKIGDKVVNQFRPRDRNVAMVFQNYALYPHMTVAGNMSFGLSLTKMPKKEIQVRVKEAARILDIHNLLHRRPSQLSGGERQRVAMGRAIVRQPDVFLFDEPLSNIDAKLRTTMRTEIKRLHQKIKSTIIYVTHDQVEAMTLADRIVIMCDGKIEQTGTAGQVFENPANIFVAGFIGSPPMNLVEAKVIDSEHLQIAENWNVPVPECKQAALKSRNIVTLGFRANDIVPQSHGLPTANPWSFNGEVLLAEPLGSETHLIVDFGGREVISMMLQPRPIKPGEHLLFELNLDRIHLFNPDTGKSITNSCP